MKAFPNIELFGIEPACTKEERDRVGAFKLTECGWQLLLKKRISIGIFDLIGLRSMFF